MKEKLTKHGRSRRSRKLRIAGLVSLVLTIGSISAFVPLITQNEVTNQKLEVEIHELDSDITKLNNQIKD